MVSELKITGGSKNVTGSYIYNDFGFPKTKTYTRDGASAYTEISYREGEVAENALSPRIYSVSFGAGSAAADQEYRYYYGNRGNITQINSKNAAGSWEAVLNYHYDANQQLTRVNDKLNNVSIRYTYDAQGNITKRQYYPYTTGTLGTATRTDTWTYGGLDGNVLVSSTIDGETTTYTRPYYGMPSTWTGGRAITWQNGTDMASIGNVTFAYDDGQRVSKTDASGIVTKYVYEGDTLKMMKRGSRYLVFLYDQNGVFGFDYIYGDTKETYYYRIDGKGEIVALTDSAGVVVANYNYDPWGKILSVTDASGAEITSATEVAKLNPFRYKSYVYDNETELYYLNSRYYDPEVCRFVSRDDAISGIGGDVRGYNLFTYCMNNPVNMTDPDGNWPQSSTILGYIAVTSAMVAAVAVCVMAAPVAVGIGVTTSSVAASVANAAIAIAGVSATAAIVKSAVEEAPTIESNYRNHSVYIMRDKTTKDVQYIGRTTRPIQRQQEHNRDPNKAHLEPLRVKYTGLSKIQARAMEQVLISAYMIQNLDNARREIAVGNVDAFEGKINNIIQIFKHTKENEILALMER